MTPAVAEVTLRGQVTIPKAVRDKYGLGHKVEVEIVDLDGSIMIVPRATVESINRMHANFDQVRDELVAADVTLDEMMAALKQIRDSNNVFEGKSS